MSMFAYNEIVLACSHLLKFELHEQIGKLHVHFEFVHACILNSNLNASSHNGLLTTNGSTECENRLCLE